MDAYRLLNSSAADINFQTIEHYQGHGQYFAVSGQRDMPCLQKPKLWPQAQVYKLGRVQFRTDVMFAYSSYIMIRAQSELSTR